MKTVFSKKEKDLIKGKGFDLLALLNERYSVRKFSSQQVEEDKIAAIIEAAKIAPSACDYQPLKIFVLKAQQLY
jgi:nitroreductase